MQHDFLVHAALKLVGRSDEILWSQRRTFVVAAKSFFDCSEETG